LNGSYTLPLDVRVSATYRAQAGPPVAATWAVPNVTVQAALGRPLAACPATGTCRATKSVSLLEPGSDYISIRQAVDMRFSKLIRLSGSRFQVNADIYNLFNENGVQSINTTFSTTNSNWQNATGVQDPRQFQLSAQFDF